MLRGDRVRSLRVQKNYTQQYLAEALNLNIRQIARYEQGQADPSGEVVARMAAVFDVSTDFLLGRTDDPTPCLQAADLTATEMQILGALRRGDVLAAIKLIVSEI